IGTKTIVLAVILGVLAFVGFSASAYLSYKNNDALLETLDSAVFGFHDYLNFITLRTFQSNDSIQPAEIDISGADVAVTDNTGLNVRSNVEVPTTPEEVPTTLEEDNTLPACSPNYESDCVYDHALWGSYYQQTLEDKVLELINEDRVRNGFQPVEYSGEVANHAYMYSKNMASIAIQEQSSPKLRVWNDYSGVVRRSCGENVWNLYNPFDPVTLRQNTNQGFLDFETSSAHEPSSPDSATLDDIANWIHAGFMGSPWGHREKVLNPMWTEAGIGIYIDASSNNRLWVTEDFCRK
ncbi:MAG: CAP domain-containing protein, partial [Nitrososphaerales archaeon]